MMAGAAAPQPLPLAALAGYLLIVALQRAGELVLSRRNLGRLRARGAVERGAGHFPIFVVLHIAWPVMLVAEVAAGARPQPWWPAWAAMWLVAQALRVAAIAALGERWNVRIVVVPGAAPVRGGIYRWLAHPNYVAVAIELLAAPLAFGAWRTAVAASALNAVAMAVRIPAEERALREAAVESRPETKTPAPRTAPGS